MNVMMTIAKALLTVFTIIKPGEPRSRIEFEQIFRDVCEEFGGDYQANIGDDGYLLIEKHNCLQEVYVVLYKFCNGRRDEYLSMVMESTQDSGKCNFYTTVAPEGGLAWPIWLALALRTKQTWK